MKHIYRMSIILFAGLLLFSLVAGCGGGGDGDDTSVRLIRTYGGSIPVGDLIAVTVNEQDKTVIHYNFTKGETNGPFPYNELPATDENANGFTILNKVTLPDANQFVLFAEFKEAAIVYQMFSNGTANGEPEYAVLREVVDASAYYDKAYNWMKFTIDPTQSTNSDFETGFASFDNQTGNGLMYGAGYSMLTEMNESNSVYSNGVKTINDSGAVKVGDFGWDATTSANIMWDPGHPDDLDYAISLIGTGSGTVILDFGPETGGGSGIAIPQIPGATDHSWIGSKAAGTYFVLLYEYKSETASRSVNPIRVNITAEGAITVYEYSTGSQLFSSTLEAVGTSTEGPNNQPISQHFQIMSTNSNANSATVTNAHLCPGAYLAVNTDQVLNVMFEPEGRFLGFTMFERNDPNYTIRFGFGIKDPNYGQ